MPRRLYDWTLDLAAHRHALWALALVSFIESSLFPIPPDVMLIPMVLAAPTRAWRIAGVCMAASVLGGLAGYGIGFFLFEQIGRPILDFYHYGDEFQAFSANYNEWGAWAVFIFGLTFLPYKVITIFSGVTHLDVWAFTLASLLARGLRFFAVAWLLWKFGAPIRSFIEARLGQLFVLFVVLVIAGMVVVKFLL